MSISYIKAFILLNLLHLVHMCPCVHHWATEIFLLPGKAQREIIDGGMQKVEAELEAWLLEGCGIEGMNTEAELQPPPRGRISQWDINSTVSGLLLGTGQLWFHRSKMQMLFLQNGSMKRLMIWECLHNLIFQNVQSVWKECFKGEV